MAPQGPATGRLGRWRQQLRPEMLSPGCGIESGRPLTLSLQRELLLCPVDTEAPWAPK